MAKPARHTILAPRLALARTRTLGRVLMRIYTPGGVAQARRGPQRKRAARCVRGACPLAAALHALGGLRGRCGSHRQYEKAQVALIVTVGIQITTVVI